MFFPHPKMESKTLGGTKILRIGPFFGLWTTHLERYTKKRCSSSLSKKMLFLHPSPPKSRKQKQQIPPFPRGVKHFSSMSCPRATTSDDIRQIRACDDSVNLPIAPLARRNPRRGETVGLAGKGSNPKEQRSFKTLGLLVYDGMFEWPMK